MFASVIDVSSPAVVEAVENAEAALNNVALPGYNRALIALEMIQNGNYSAKGAQEIARKALLPESF